MPDIGRILLVEDDPKDVELTMTALEEYNLSNEVVVASDGQEALDYLFYRGKFQLRSGDNPGSSARPETAKGRRTAGAGADKVRRQVETHSRGRAHLFAGGTGHGGEL